MNLLLMQCLKHCNAASVEAALLTVLRTVSFVKTNELNHEAALRDLVLNIHDLVTKEVGPKSMLSEIETYL